MPSRIDTCSTGEVIPSSVSALSADASACGSKLGIFSCQDIATTRSVGTCSAPDKFSTPATRLARSVSNCSISGLSRSICSCRTCQLNRRAEAVTEVLTLRKALGSMPSSAQYSLIRPSTQLLNSVSGSCPWIISSRGGGAFGSPVAVSAKTLSGPNAISSTSCATCAPVITFCGQAQWRTNNSVSASCRHRAICRLRTGSLIGAKMSPAAADSRCNITSGSMPNGCDPSAA